MLTDFEWADRMAIPVTFIQAVGQPRAAAYMQSLATWRLPQHVDRRRWITEVATQIGHAPASVTRSSTTMQLHNRAAFFNALYTKCMNLYGAGGGDSADSLALARHPWSLTEDVFANAYEAICKHKLPGTDIVPDRGRWSATATLLSAVPALAGAALTTAIPPVSVAFAIVGGLGAGAGAAIDVSRDSAADRESSQIRESFAGYGVIYEREKDYRKKETAIS